MKGSITKYTINGSSRPRWRYRIYISTDATTGKQTYDGRGGFEKQSEAEAAMRSRIDDLSRPVAPAIEQKPPEETLGGWLQRWIDTYAARQCAPTTVERYRKLARYLSPPLTDSLLTTASHGPIEAALFTLLHAPAKRRDHLSPRTVRHVAGLLSAALEKAFRLDMIQVNPMRRVELPAYTPKEARALTAHEIEALRAVCRGDWTYPLIEVDLATGARRGELLALMWSDIDWTRKTITIARSLEQTAAGLRVKGTKSAKVRRFMLPESAIAALRFQRDTQSEARRLFGATYTDRDLIFCAPDGDYLQPDLLSQTIVRRLKKAGVKGASLHTLRHTHASTLLSRGVPIATVSKRLGHADPAVTHRVYSHVLPGDDERAADAWDDACSHRRLQ